MATALGNGLPLFIGAPDPTIVETGLPLSISGHSGDPGMIVDLPLFVEGGDAAGSAGGLPLFIEGPALVEASLGLPLFVGGGYDVVEGGLPLFLKSGGSDCWPTWQNWDVNWEDLDDHTWDCANEGGGEPAGGALRLFLKGSRFGQMAAGLNLFLKQPEGAGLPLFLQGPSIAINSALPLFVCGHNSIGLGLPLFIHGHARLMKGLPLYICGN